MKRELTIDGSLIGVDAYNMSDADIEAIASKLAEIQNYLDASDERAPEIDIHDVFGGDYHSDGGNYSVQTVPVGDTDITIYFDGEGGEIMSITASRDGLRSHLLDWDYDGVPTATWLADWEIDEDGPEEVDEDYGGECAVWVQPHYYAGTCNAPRPDYMRDDEGEYRVFASREEAQSTLDAMDAAVGDLYRLGHGEYAPPEYKIVEAI